MKNAKVGITGILFLISDQVTTPQKRYIHNKKLLKAQSVQV